jgi:hypothetical protein
MRAAFSQIITALHSIDRTIEQLNPGVKIAPRQQRTSFQILPAHISYPEIKKPRDPK